MQSTLSAPPAQRSRDTLEAMARMAGTTRSIVHVVVQREAGVVDFARAAALLTGVTVQVDLMATTMRARFDGSNN